MATSDELVKRKLELQMSPHSVSIQFLPNAISLPDSMPPLYLRIARGSRCTTSPHATLEEVVAGSMVYTATWPSCTLTLNVALNRHSVSGKFEAKEIKIQLKIYSEGKPSHKNLASCAYNINCLNLSALDFVAASSETRQVSLNMGKSASATIHSIILDATFHYKYLADDFDISVEQSRSRESSPHPRSVSPQSPVVTSLFHDFGISTVGPAALSHQDATPSLKDNKQDVQQVPHPEREQHVSLSNATDQTTFSQGGLHQQSRHLEGQKDGQRLSLPTDRPPKVQRKKFQWLKKIKGKPRGGSQAEGVQSGHSSEMSSSVVSSEQPEDLEMQVENDENPSLPTMDCEASYQGFQSDLRHNKNDIQQSQSEAQQPPPKPKRRANRTKVATRAVQSSNEQTEAQVQENTVSELPSSGKVESQGPIETGRSEKEPSPTADDSADERVRSNSAPSIAQQQGEGISLLSTSHEFSPKRKSGGRKAHVSHLPKRYQLHSHVQSALISPTVESTRGLSKQLSGSTPVLSGPNLTKNQRCLSASHLANPEAIATHHSIGDLIKPTATTSHSSVESQPEIKSKQPKENHFGILKVRLKAVDTASDSHSSKQNQVDFTPSADNEDPTDQSQMGLHCIFTINGSNGRFVSSVQPLVPRRTVFWDDEEEMLFYAAQSKQLFILCRKTTPPISGAPQTVTSRRMSRVHEDKCIGAAVLDISTVAIRSSTSAVNTCKLLAEMACQDVKLSIQPKGSMLLQGCFYVLQPRFKVSCVGTLTIQNLSGLNCNPDDDLSCTIKVDTEFQNSTNPQRVEECNHTGWSDEPVDFKAYCAFDCDIQIWAYSSEETEYWCGGCTIPLAMLLPDEDIRRHSLRQEDDVALTPSKHVDKIIKVPVEPKGEITLSFLLYPSLRSRSHTPLTGGSAEDESSLLTSSADLSTSTEALQNYGSVGPDQASAMTISKRGSLRRTTVKRTGSFNLRVLKNYSEEPFNLEQENTDLKKEVEFLREELRQTKAKLAESEFYREQTLLELKYLQENPTQPESSEKDPKSRKTSKPQQKRK